MKRALTIVLVLILFQFVSIAETKHEGKGFTCPEDAVEAYLDAMNRGDVDEMISTFAIESFVDNYDVDKYLKAVKSFSPSYAYIIPIYGGYARSLSINYRYSILAGLLYTSYIEKSTALNGEPIRVIDADGRQMITEMFSSSLANNLLGNMSNISFINPSLLDKRIEAIFPLVNTTRYADYYGAEDFTCIAALFTLNEEEALQLMSCAKYGGRWYNLELGGGNSLAALSVSPYAAGLLIGEDLLTLKAKMKFENTPLSKDEISLLETNATSDLPGTYWQLTDVNSNDTVMNSIEKVQEDTQGYSVYGLLHFMRTGAVWTNVFSPRSAELIKEVYNLDGDKDDVIIIWTEKDDKLYLKSAQGVVFSAEEGDATLIRSGNQIKLKTDWGSEWTFEKIVD